MHKVAKIDGWEWEVLADESDELAEDSSGSENCPTKDLEKKLAGCSFIKEIKVGDSYIAELRYEERVHNELIFVEAVVFRKNGVPHKENTEKDVAYFRRSTFDGDACKGEAAKYAYSIKESIERDYFS